MYNLTEKASYRNYITKGNLFKLEGFSSYSVSSYSGFVTTIHRNFYRGPILRLTYGGFRVTVVLLYLNLKWFLFFRVLFFAFS